MTLVLEILLLEEPEEMAFCTETLKEVCKPVEDCHHLLMNTLIISTFSCTFETFEKDVSGFITDMGKEVVSDYEFVKVNDHKSHLLMNVIDMDALCTEMSSDEAKEWDKKIIVRIPYMQLSLLDDVIIDRRSKVEGV